MVASKPGYADAWAGTESTTEIPIRPGDDIEGISLVLRGGTLLSGRVVDAANQPVPDATVRVIIAKQGDVTTIANYTMTYTDDEGVFVLGFAKPGWATLRVYSEEHEASVFDKIPIQDEEMVELKLEAPARIYGTVTFASGQPAPDVRITIGNNPETLTDQNGLYSMDLQSNIEHGARVHSKENIKLIEDTYLDAFAPGEEREWNIIIPNKPITIRGRLIGIPSGKSLTNTASGLSMYYWRDGVEKVLSNLMHENGRYTAHPLGGPGRYTFQLYYMFAHDERAAGDLSDPIDIEEGEEVELDLSVPEPQEAIVRVVDSAGDPVEGAAIIAQTDDSGSFFPRILSVADGRMDRPLYMVPYDGFYMEARMRGYAPARGLHHTDGAPGTVYPEETLVLWPPSGIEGTLVAPDGTVLANTEFELFFTYGQQGTATIDAMTDASGHFTILDQFPATVINLKIQSFLSEENTVPGTWIALNVDAPEGAILDFGDVRLEIGEPLEQ